MNPFDSVDSSREGTSSLTQKTAPGPGGFLGQPEQPTRPVDEFRVLPVVNQTARGTTSLVSRQSISVNANYRPAHCVGRPRTSFEESELGHAISTIPPKPTSARAISTIPPKPTSVRPRNRLGQCQLSRTCSPSE